jgi:hypothetical protein
LLSKQTSTPKMSSRRELNSLKSDLKQSIGKTGKRTPTQTQILDLTPETKRVSKSNSFSLKRYFFCLSLIQNLSQVCYQFWIFLLLFLLINLYFVLYVYCFDYFLSFNLKFEFFKSRFLS